MLLAKSCKRWRRWRFCTTVVSQVTSNPPRCSSLIPRHGALPSVHHVYKRMPSKRSNKVDTCPPGTKRGREYLADEARKRKKKKLESQPTPTKCTRRIAEAIEELATPPPTTPPPVVVTGLRSSPRLMRSIKPTCCNYGKNRKLLWGDEFNLCSKCDDWDNLPDDAKWQCKHDSTRFRCTANHTSLYNPTEQKKEHCL